MESTHELFVSLAELAVVAQGSHLRHPVRVLRNPNTPTPFAIFLLSMYNLLLFFLLYSGHTLNMWRGDIVYHTTTSTPGYFRIRTAIEDF